MHQILVQIDGLIEDDPFGALAWLKGGFSLVLNEGIVEVEEVVQIEGSLLDVERVGKDVLLIEDLHFPHEPAIPPLFQGILFCIFFVHENTTNSDVLQHAIHRSHLHFHGKPFSLDGVNGGHEEENPRDQVLLVLEMQRAEELVLGLDDDGGVVLSSQLDFLDFREVNIEFDLLLLVNRGRDVDGRDLVLAAQREDSLQDLQGQHEKTHYHLGRFKIIRISCLERADGKLVQKFN